MGTYLKHDDVSKEPKKKRESKKETPRAEYSQTSYRRVCEWDKREPTDLGGIEYALDSIASAMTRYVSNAEMDGHNSLAIHTGPEGSGYYPLLIALEPTSESTERLLDNLERIANAFERIADALNATQANNPKATA
jgi:hypothetical protein